MNSKGVYSIKSFYKFVNFRGVLPISSPAIWKIKIPPRIQIFLWLLTNNKLLTRDNLCKRQNVDDLTCVFCNGQESCSHLFSTCVVAVEFWKAICVLTGINEDINIMSISMYWMRGDSFAATNIVHATGLWAIWKTRNDMVFNNVCWSGLQVIWRKTASNLSSWECLSSGCAKDKVTWAAKELEVKARSPPLLLWPDPG